MKRYVRDSRFQGLIIIIFLILSVFVLAQGFTTVPSNILSALATSPFAGAEEGEEPGIESATAPAVKRVPPPDSYDLPPIEVIEWRALEAEIRAIQAEANLAIVERNQKRQEILNKWEAIVGERDLSGWRIDLEAGKLRKLRK